jgi:hypothetical protein
MHICRLGCPFSLNDIKRFLSIHWKNVSKEKNVKRPESNFKDNIDLK